MHLITQRNTAYNEIQKLTGTNGLAVGFSTLASGVGKL